MKNEKDIVKFFNRYSEKMLPADGEQFIEKLKQNMDVLPVPSAFNKTDKGMLYAKWSLEKLKRNYKRSKREAIISGILVSIVIAIAFFVINVLGVLDINIFVTICALVLMDLVSIILLYSLFPLHAKSLL